MHVKIIRDLNNNVISMIFNCHGYQTKTYMMQISMSCVMWQLRDTNTSSSVISQRSTYKNTTPTPHGYRMYTYRSVL